jgi:hypothetical protein
MSFTVTCTCGKKLSAHQEHVGKRAKCPQCGQLFLIPPQAPLEPSAEKGVGKPPPLYDGQRADHWLDLLETGDPAERKKAANILAGVGPEAASELSVFVERSASQNVLVRHWATSCIGRIGPAAKGALNALLDRLSDEQPLVREKAARSIEQVLPDAKSFLLALLHGLDEKEENRRAAAMELFRLNLKTAGISRFRFWACTCGRVYIKLDLDQRLRKMVDAPDEVDWDGTRTCRQCGAQFDDRDVYSGKYDVPEPHWPKLRSKFGDQLSVPDDFLSAAPQDVVYRISEDARLNEAPIIASSLAPFSISLESPAALEIEQGYAIASATVPPVYGVLGSHGAIPAGVELVPDTTVPRSGKYRCTACSKKRLSTASAEPSPARASVVMQFKEGKTFTECPNCGDLTEWEWLQ